MRFYKILLIALLIAGCDELPEKEQEALPFEMKNFKIDVLELTKPATSGNPRIVVSISGTNENLQTINEIGIVWSKSPAPTISDSIRIVPANSTGSEILFTDTIEFTESNQTLYLRGFVESENEDIIYSDERSFDTPTFRIVSVDKAKVFEGDTIKMAVENPFSTVEIFLNGISASAKKNNSTGAYAIAVPPGIKKNEITVTATSGKLSVNAPSQIKFLRGIWKKLNAGKAGNYRSAELNGKIYICETPEDLWVYNSMNDLLENIQNDDIKGYSAISYMYTANNQLYLLAYGGRGMYVFDFSVNEWKAHNTNDFPAAWRGGGLSFSANGYVYLGLGIKASETDDFISPLTFYNDMWRYDPEHDEWMQMSDFPGEPRMHASTVVIGSAAYVIMGQGSEGFLSDIWKYDIPSDEWTKVTDFPFAARESPAVAVHHGKLIIGGGVEGVIDVTSRIDIYFQQSRKIHSDFFEYDLAADTWVELNNSVYAGPGIDFNLGILQMHPLEPNKFLTRQIGYSDKNFFELTLQF